jgi:hypothetical protein
MFLFPIKNRIRLFLFKYKKQLSQIFFFYLFSYNREYEANKYSYSLFSFIFFFDQIIHYKKLFPFRKFKHLNSSLLKCRSNKKIFLIISVFFLFIEKHTFSLVFILLLELSYARLHTRSGLTNLRVS